ncbi:DUF2383 domain-containing protein [Halalkalibacter krulwichiae]|uniref:Ferritin-like domain protein n=1 Tax=Halalkalibacter krulwichiae TaxID=199441 RepID=A0A1X9MA94_9BACI|nr:DUF2383 domain-containing protein [Halalkalibacter krulwichiae]ARK29574.1 Ferritin-like domain protein [Halalkalibacter krulwichiae]
MNTKTIKELNQFLEGNFMAIHAYENYIEHIDNAMMKQTLQQLQQEHKQHAMLVAERIQNLGGVPVDDVGLRGNIAEIFIKLKGTTYDPIAIIKDAKVGEQRGIDKSKQILEGDLDKESLDLVQDILNKDTEHIERLDQLLH